MKSISFLTSKGVVEINKNRGYDTYWVYLNRYYIGSVLDDTRFQHQNEDKPTFTNKERQMLVDIAHGKTVPKSQIFPIPLVINGEPWEAKLHKPGTYWISNTDGMHQGDIWQEIHEGRPMWVSDKINYATMLQIAPQMLTVKK